MVEENFFSFAVRLNAKVHFVFLLVGDEFFDQEGVQLPSNSLYGYILISPLSCPCFRFIPRSVQQQQTTLASSLYKLVRLGHKLNSIFEQPWV